MRRHRRGSGARFTLPMPPWLFALVAGALAGCQAALPERVTEAGHLAAPAGTGPIPDIVRPAAPEPQPTYTLRAQDAAVRDLLTALARDAQLDLDLHPQVRGRVTLHAVDQPLGRILRRIARQADLRIELAGSQLTVTPDRPYLRSYHIDYVNLARRSDGTVSVATEVATTGLGALEDKNARAGENTSATRVVQESANRFWDTLVENVRGVLGAGEESAGAILVNRESGLLTVLATDRQHEAIGEMLDAVLARARKQVLIEATVVEVELSDRFQAGVDWSMFDEDNGIRIDQQVLAGNLTSPPVTTITIDRPGAHNLLAIIRMLERFGDLRVLSSPKVMALNNQTAMLKVVDNRVYFTIDVDLQAATANSPAITTFESNVHTVPVGFIMAVTPQISEDAEVTLNVRPTITRVLGFVRDPNPALAEAGVVSEVPEIQVREIESVLKVASGEIAVLGGLMQDTDNRRRSGIPLLSRLPIIGQVFSFRDEEVRKTELLVFLRPTVIAQGSVQSDLRRFRDALPGTGGVGEES
ncbi:MAG: type II secretion system protein GspD [Thiohalomonadaceae bacterium]